MNCTIKVVNNTIIEFSSTKCIEFVKEVARPLSGKWQRTKQSWQFDANQLDDVIEGAKEWFDDITVRHVEVPVLDRQSDTRRKIIMGAAILSITDKIRDSDDSDDIELVRRVDEIIELLKPADRILFAHKEQTKPWRWAKPGAKVTSEVEIV